MGNFERCCEWLSKGLCRFTLMRSCTAFPTWPATSTDPMEPTRECGFIDILIIVNKIEPLFINVRAVCISFVVKYLFTLMVYFTSVDFLPSFLLFDQL